MTDPLEPGPMDQFSAHLDRGWDLVHRGDLAGALISAQKSLELDAQSPEAYNLLGFVRAAQGESSEALEHYNQALALDETFVEAMLNAAEVMIHPMHDFDGAQSMVRDALDFAEDDDEIADALLISIDAHMHKGDEQAAAKVVRRLPEGPFGNPRLDFLVGRAHFEIEELEAANRHFSRAVARDASNPELHYYLGLLHEARGEADAATSAFIKARKLDLLEPEPPWALSEELFEGQIKRALGELPAPLADALRGAMVVISDLPGVELVAEGVDPRTALVMEAVNERDGLQVAGRLFIYKRNIQRFLEDPRVLPEQLRELLEQELTAAFAPPEGGE